MKRRFWMLGVLVGAASPALAGPPYLTDDPVPTDLGHWEIYAFTSAQGGQSSVDGESGFDINYGGVRNVQLTATLPLGFEKDPGEDWHWGTSDVELAVKYRFLDDQKGGFSAAIFPRVFLPTSSLARGEHLQLLLPLWLEKDFKGGTSIFGGGGYQVNPGPGNLNFWQAGGAVTQDVGHKIALGAEIFRQGPDAVGETVQTSAGVGGTVQLSPHYGLLFSGGPTFADRRTGYHLYGSLGLFF